MTKQEMIDYIKTYLSKKGIKHIPEEFIQDWTEDDYLSDNSEISLLTIIPMFRFAYIFEAIDNEIEDIDWKVLDNKEIEFVELYEHNEEVEILSFTKEAILNMFKTYYKNGRS
jgi:uncharacterized protein YeeX (DUF496 family)